MDTTQKKCLLLLALVLAQPCELSARALSLPPSAVSPPSVRTLEQALVQPPGSYRHGAFARVTKRLTDWCEAWLSGRSPDGTGPSPMGGESLLPGSFVPVGSESKAARSYNAKAKALRRLGVSSETASQRRDMEFSLSGHLSLAIPLDEVDPFLGLITALATRCIAVASGRSSERPLRKSEVQSVWDGLGLEIISRSLESFQKLHRWVLYFPTGGPSVHHWEGIWVPTHEKDLPFMPSSIEVTDERLPLPTRAAESVVNNHKRLLKALEVATLPALELALRKDVATVIAFLIRELTLEHGRLIIKKAVEGGTSPAGYRSIDRAA